MRYNAKARQSTCLVRMDGLTILTDPIFTKRTINDYIGPKRLRPMPCSLEDIKDSIDIVIISHDHFDHLGNSCSDSIKKKSF